MNLDELIREFSDKITESGFVPEVEQKSLCPICDGTGRLIEPAEQGKKFLPGQSPKVILCQCKVLEKRAKHRGWLVEQSMIGGLRHCTFETWIPRTERVACSANEAKRLLEVYACGESSYPWVLLSGDKGSGKSHLAASVVNYRIDHGFYDENDMSPIFREASEILNDLRRSYEDKENGNYFEVLDRYKNCSLLVIDDLGTENQRNKDYADEQFFLILNHRYKNREETIVTTNAPRTSFNPRLASRLSDRVIVQPIQIDNGDYRKIRRS